MIFILALAFSTLTLTAETSVVTALKSFSLKDQELYLNNSFARGIPNAPQDRVSALTYDWSTHIRMFQEFSTRQFVSFTLLDSLLLTPMQQRIVGGSDAQAAPRLDMPVTYAKTVFSASGLQALGADISGTIKASFGGLFYVGAFYGLYNAYIQAKWQNDQLIIGEYAHPFSTNGTDANLVTLGFGAPFSTELCFVPQVNYEHRLSQHLATTLTLYGPSLSNNAGPYGFTSDYQTWSGVPSCNVKFNVKTGPAYWGVAVDFKRIKPRLITSNDVIDLSNFQVSSEVFAPPVLAPNYIKAQGEHISSVILSAFTMLRDNNIDAKAQIFWGGNGVELINMGGYGVTSMQQVPSTPGTENPSYLWKYTNIPYVSMFCDIEASEPLGSRFIPGIFAGFTKPLSTSQDLVRDPETDKFVVYTLDDRLNAIGEVFNAGVPQKNIMQLLRIAPRVWIILGHLATIGVELTYMRAVHADFDKNYRPINPESVSLLRCTIGTYCEF